MKQEDKDLLLRYLSMALPYDVILDYSFIADKQRIHTKMPLTYRNIGTVVLDEWHTNEEIFKPYLRPMSSMTEEEDKQRIQLGIWRSSQTNGHEVTGIKPDISQSYNSQAFQRAFNFLFKNHFDIFGLIPRDLAVEVTKENNPYNIVEK